MIEWPSTSLFILGCSEPQCGGVFVVALFVVVVVFIVVVVVVALSQFSPMRILGKGG